METNAVFSGFVASFEIIELQKHIRSPKRQTYEKRSGMVVFIFQSLVQNNINLSAYFQLTIIWCQ